MSITASNCPLNLSLIANREFRLRSKGEWSDEDSSTLLLFDSIADEISTLKERIGQICASECDGLRRWRLHTQETHPLSMAPRLLKEQYNCRNTSQSYCKFLEILARYPQLVRNCSHQQPFRSFHLCEAPGHFITALDRFICTFHSNMDWFWEANSLNPHNETTDTCDMILEDEIILGQPARWHFGKDGTGDIRKWDNEYLTSLVSSGRYFLITADGSFYTQDVPSEQELRTLPLLEIEFNIAMKLLSEGGSLVIKVYTFFMPQTRNLIIRVASCFDEVSVFKPMSSKGGNNEVGTKYIPMLFIYGLNVQRYMICIGYRYQKAIQWNEADGNHAVRSCEIYFSKLQSLFMEANIRTYNTITKADLGVFRDCVLREFRKRTLASYIAMPKRDSHLLSPLLDRPWIGMFGSNYVENLRHICDKRSAVQHLKDFLQLDCMKEYDIIEDIEVEFADDEVEFIGWPLEKLIDEKVIVTGSTSDRIVHSLFVPPVLLRSLLKWKPEVLLDFCDGTNKNAQYVHSLEYSGHIIIDVCKIYSKKDWIFLLKSVLFGVMKQKISNLSLVWSAGSTPFILSRFSASVLAILCIMFFNVSFTGGSTFATFSMPNYPEDLPSGFELYLSLLSRISVQTGNLCCFVPYSMLAMMHPHLLSVNRRQWRDLLSVESISDLEVT
ncbi:ribosomal RNA large subunit methyltransferase J [Dictyocaulus viviparus]|uniref:Cap-specific mRNA (nucleoside-2'-O-)-methyltransferase 2 n=1 Tax=Dictyocaulus viviparus TaxID=29172 RepID=A0A0D8Y2S8_DICVI|nr:ribosomal RNA large subunit methyltransferase J [Dictyocaulus viviparus]